MNDQHLNSWLAARRKQRSIRHSADLAKKLQSGDRNALSAAITVVESQNSEDRRFAESLIEACLPASGNSIRIGITGVPGVGKSSFIEVFGKQVLDAGFRLCVLTIDPSSERSGGSILGDKTRMETLASDERAFIRPTASGNELGGVARNTRETIILCEAAGYDFILIETVGVGQSETLVHSMTDFFLLLLLAGAGDELQGIKRGIMEMADGLIVTKADGDNKKRANLAASELRNAIHLFPPTESGWIPEVLVASSLEKQNIGSVLAMILRYVEHARIKGYFEAKRKIQEQVRLQEAVKEMLMNDFRNNSAVNELFDRCSNMVSNFEITAYQAARAIFDKYRGKG